MRQVRRGDRGDAGARRHGSQRGHGDRHVHHPQRRLRALRQRHRPLSGGGAHVEALPLPGAGLGDGAQRDGVAPHDAVGSNIHLHVRRGRVLRVVPRANESINEVWISDRDRFGYEGLYSDDRVPAPMVRRDGVWNEVSWEEALEATVRGLREVVSGKGEEAVGALASASCTLEELFLFQKLVRSIGCANVDHRVRQRDFSDQGRGPGPSVHRHGRGRPGAARRGAADRLLHPQGASHRQPPAAQGESRRGLGDAPGRDGPRPEPGERRRGSWSRRRSSRTGWWPSRWPRPGWRIGSPRASKP